ncbi:aldolase [Nocardiopsis sp. MG754419]|nr:aldolase [Nocardiopsis sp. MG754419]
MGPHPPTGPVTPERVRAITETRLTRPTAITEAADRRSRPEAPVGPSGRALIIAADHPARGSLRAGRRPQAMADRADLLSRLCRALDRPGVTGVLGTADVLDDLLLLGALEGKTVFGSMNRGGLVGADWEIDDRFTGCTARGLLRAGFEGGKMLLRLDYADGRTARTLEHCARAVSELADAGLVAMVEPFVSGRPDGPGQGLRNDLSTEAVVRAAGIAAGLGPSSAHTWLKLPAVDDMERVAAATTLPTVILGGEVAADPDAAYARWARALEPPNVIGLAVGRSLLYPADDDVEAAVDTAVGLL